MSDLVLPLAELPPILACKICGGAAGPLGAVDFNRCCADGPQPLPPAGIAVPYHRCASCGFLFTTAFDGWDQARFKRDIYNADYVIADPDYLSGRSQTNAENIDNLFHKNKDIISILDYGGGRGDLARALRARGFARVSSYDPFEADGSARPDGVFELVSCFEVLEHLPDPLGTIGLIAGYVRHPGMVYFSTFVQPEGCDLNWSYVAPRNGHVSIFSRMALRLAWARHGFTVSSYDDNYHFAVRAESAGAWRRTDMG